MMQRSGRFLVRIAWGIFMFIVVFLLYKAGDKLLTARGHGNVSLESYVFTESNRELLNPNRGCYYIYGFYINDEDTDFRQEVSNRFSRDRETKLALVQINLQDFRDRPISKKGLENLEELLRELGQVDKRLILRFLYDWDGENEEYEPENIDLILQHIRQVAPLLREYKDLIFTMQGLFVGNWGEMWGTSYSDPSSIQRLAKELMEATDPSTFLAVRMPMQWRMATQIGEATKVVRGDGTLASRLGLFNDGMLGSWSDYGTYGEQTKEEHGYFTYWNREQELEFQEILCKNVPMGGEVIIDNSYNDFENALQDMKRMHVTYLNKDYDRNVLDKWARYTVNEEGCFQGMDGLSYMERHLGYRLLIHQAALDYQYIEDILSVNIEVQNVGFAPVYHETKVWVVLKEEEGNAVHSYLIDYDPGILSGGCDTVACSMIHEEISLAGWTGGRYGVYLDIQDAATGERILLANEQDPEEYGYKVGTMVITSASE